MTPSFPSPQVYSTVEPELEASLPAQPIVFKLPHNSFPRECTLGKLPERAAEDFDFAERLEELNEELEVLNAEARELEARIAENVILLLEGTSQ